VAHLASIRQCDIDDNEMHRTRRMNGRQEAQFAAGADIESATDSTAKQMPPIRILRRFTCVKVLYTVLICDTANYPL
jgi:predicted heme/steroid binding protein